MTTVLEANGVHAGYGAVTVVRDLSLRVDEGEVVVLLGRNGAGKTTSLLTLAGAIKTQQGEVHYLGRPERGSLSSRARRGVGLMTDDRAILLSLTVAENLRVARGRRDTLDLFPELVPLLDRPAGLLSGGQQQMLGLAAVLSREPKLLLIDELSFGLAPLIVQRLMEAVRAAAERGTAVIMVEQFARLALGVADRAYVLLNGTVETEGSAADLLADIDQIEQAYLGTH
jgi:ABC-type branched-subunit amino acid transport system ATPase component